MRSTATRSLLLLSLLLAACKVATIRSIETEENQKAAGAFDAAAHAESLWTEDVPSAIDRAVDLGELLPALAEDPTAAGERWGRREGSGRLHVVVKGQGRVRDVDTSSRTGIAVVEIECEDGTLQVRLQIGPVLRGTSIRDALPTVSFDQFVNQIQYADVAGALNVRAEGELAALEPEALVGKRIRFAGMVTLGDPPLTVTPVRLEREGLP